MLKIEPLKLHLKDISWPMEVKKYKVRNIVRAIIYTNDGHFYFVNPSRDDDFGKLDFIETSGGGVEKGESLKEAINRELKEELGLQIEIVAYLGIVKDYYNLISRENHNHYFLVKALSVGEKHLTQDELEEFKIKTLRIASSDALAFYSKNYDTLLGRLIYEREVPIFNYAIKVIKDNHLTKII